MEIDRDALYDRLEELARELDGAEFEDEGAMDVANESLDLAFIRDLYYLVDEGFIEMDDEGRMFPIAEAVCLDLAA